MKKQIKLQNILSENPAVIISLVYVLLITLGMLHEYLLFRAFGLQFINYISLEDMLLVGLKNPNYFFFAGLVRQPRSPIRSVPSFPLQDRPPGLASLRETLLR